MERIAIHVATLNGLATDTAFLQGGGTYGRLRTAIINAVQRVSGNRFGRGWIRPGKTKAISEALRNDLIQTINAFARDFTEVNQLMLNSYSVKARFKDTGVVTPKTADELGLKGVVARASGMRVDTRADLPCGPYYQFPIDVQFEEDGDCWARMKMRMREVDASVSWLLNALNVNGASAASGEMEPGIPACLDRNALREDAHLPRPGVPRYRLFAGGHRHVGSFPVGGLNERTDSPTH